MSNLKKLLVKEVAEVLGVDRRTISRWCKTEDFPKNEDGTFSAAECVKWVVDRIETRLQEESTVAIPSDEWLAEFRKFRAKREELAFQRDSAQVLPVSEVFAEWVKRINTITYGLQAWADRLPVVLASRTRDEIARVLAAEVNLLRKAFAREGAYTPKPVCIVDEDPEMVFYREHWLAVLKPNYMRWIPEERIFVDERDGTRVKASEMNAYVNKYPYKDGHDDERHAFLAEIKAKKRAE